MHYIVGLGNPGEEYENTRHNMGRMVLWHFRSAESFPEWVESKKYTALISEGALEGEKTLLLLPETYMNKSGASLKTLVLSPKKAEKLIVVYDDLDLPLGTFKISFGRGSGGHKGVESVIRAVKTKDFVRLRVGIAPVTPGGKLKKPKGERAVADFILGAFRPAERDILKKVFKKTDAALRAVIAHGRMRAMNEFN